MNEIYDLIIIGGSAAATGAGIYAARRKLNFKIITKEFGGEVATSGVIENWPGIQHTDGLALADSFLEHLKSLGVEPETEVEVSKITKQDDGLFCITVKEDGEHMASDKLGEGHEGPLKCDYQARTLLVTTGVHPRELNVPGEKELRGKGVTYCTTCDGPLFAGKIVATVGGGNSALESALMMADIASKVYVLNKNAEFKGEQVMIDNLKAKSNVEIISSADTVQVLGTGLVSGLKYKKDGAEHELQLEGIMVHIGMVPNSWLVPPEVEKNQFGNIKVNAAAETSVPGLYAAGDVTDTPFNQIVIAAGQGVTALLSAVNYLNKLKK